MDKFKEGVEVKLDPKIQDLYARLEEEKLKNERLQLFEKENEMMRQRINELENQKAGATPADSKKKIRNVRKKMALQEQLQEKKILEELLVNRQVRIDALADSLDEQQVIQELDTKSLAELKEAVNSLIESREKREEQVRKLSRKNRILLEENENLKFARTRLAHDLRSLMSSIVSTLSLIQLGEKEVAEELLPVLEERSQVFMNLINAINSNDLSKENLLINDIVRLLNLTDGKTRQSAQITVSGDQTPISANKAALYDILQNLINNSLKYSELSTDQVLIQIDVSEDTTSTQISISDNGVGIPPASQQKIFNLYERGGLVDKRGKGIGLYMVKQMVEGNGGTIRYDADYKKGARFVIRLPRPSEAVQEPDASGIGFQSPHE